MIKGGAQQFFDALHIKSLFFVIKSVFAWTQLIQQKAKQTFNIVLHCFAAGAVFIYNAF
jgi:hypothetical protein